MRKTALIGAASVALLGTSATAQSAFIQALPDVLGQVVSGMNTAAPDKCFDGRWSPSAADNDKGKVRVQSGLDHYRELAGAGADVSKAFIGSKSFRRWRLDGEKQDPRSLHDPWIGQAARLEQVAFTTGNWNGGYHVQWKALAADGTMLGLYDAWMNKSDTGSRFIWLDLYSPAQTDKAMANIAFCDQPGDVEVWKEAQAKRAAKKAAKLAAEQADRATQGN